MKFFTSKSSFLEAIKFSSNFSSDNNFEQLLKNLYIKIDNKECKIYSSNGQVSSIYKIEDDIDVEEEGEVIVNAKKLITIIQSIVSDNFTLAKLDNQLIIRAGKMQTSLNLEEDVSYPEIEIDDSNFSVIDVDSFLFAKSIKKVIHSTSFQTTKNSISSAINFQKEADDMNIWITGSDAIKLSSCYYKVNDTEDALKAKFNFSVNALSLSYVAAFLKDKDQLLLKISKKSDKVVLTNNKFVLYLRVENEPFPEFKKILNANKVVSSFLVDKDLISNNLHALTGVLSLSDQGKNNADANFEILKNTLRISTNSFDIASYSSEFDISEFQGEAKDINLNPFYLQEHIKMFESKDIEFKLLLQSAISGCILKVCEKNNDQFKLKFVQVLAPSSTN
ncbi:DNA polymerase III subunit beta [Mycoplasmoides gallisepticum]|uniref:DNA polymerase III subunit beta n=3 Tax=Mycoplasmoides gallisepticum TaxID=2096 RepID=A0AB36DS61_MYCGL|nr:DNA polymerase III subunit beta [Mycoplasmoides gallisepticum]OBU78529.1 DNA polymerase III subunit beta [Mycoplasmoides gallisepticum]OBU78591.1 DNA polymerase III subunit beta [Mycoplasmoides gallisepticum]OBU80407.1 DNA polymerase III subunit beta [Mycoplasmoides gallisepticum]OBU80508.1 DNA polymerase III subunit beta [Mycoplasmoides gallisepticum]OBU80649.1 DNA polymerase III subunit beta [Mycoplasmoides gallisepticum]